MRGGSELRGRAWLVAGALVALLLGCAHLGHDTTDPDGEREELGEVYITVVPKAFPPLPTGRTMETLAAVAQLRSTCYRVPGDVEDTCDHEVLTRPSEVVSYTCEGFEPTIEVVQDGDVFTFRSTSDESGKCDLVVVLRDLETGLTYEGSAPIAFSAPERLAVEHRVAADPGLYYPVLVGAAFTVLPAVYGSIEAGGTNELYYLPEDWEVELEGEAFACGCAAAPAACQIWIPEETSMEYQIDLHAVAAGTSTLTVRNGGLERVVTLEAVEESAVVGMELYQPVRALGLIDAEEDPLERFEQVTEIEVGLPSGVRDAELASVLVLVDGRRAWGGAGVYFSSDQYVHLSRPANHSCSDAPGETLSWMTVWGSVAREATISAELGSASVEYSVAVLPEM